MSRYLLSTSISGLVVEYIVAIDVTRVRFPADALFIRAAEYVGFSVEMTRHILPGVVQVRYRTVAQCANMTRERFELPTF